MSNVSQSAECQRLKDGVFQPSRAQIAREMKCRLGLCDDNGSKPERKRPH
jgi:hypothetical protein